MRLKDRLSDYRSPSPEEEKKIIMQVKETIKSGDDLGDLRFQKRQDIKDKLTSLIKKIAFEDFEGIDLIVEDCLVERVLSEIFGLGILERFLSDRSVTDIFIIDRSMIIIKDGIKVFLGEVFKDLDDVYLLIDKIKNNSSKQLDQRVPFLNTELYDGSRCSVIIPPASDRVYISIRVFNCKDYQLLDLCNSGMFEEKAMLAIEKYVQERKNILIAGCMGSGKTTLLNTLAKLIPKDEFINLIQDVPEISLGQHPYLRMLTTRPRNREIENEINHDRLLYETLRMKADRIIVGEVRDSMAAYQMLQALNTGHRGSFSTIHADSAYDALIRLEILSLEYKPNLNSHVLKKMISRAIDLVLYLECFKDKKGAIKRKIEHLVLVSDELDRRGDYLLEHQF